MSDQKLTVGELVYKISGDMDNLKTELKKAETEISKLKESAEKTESAISQLDKVGGLIKKTFAGIGGLFAVDRIVSFLGSARQASLDFEFQQVKLAQTLRTTTDASDEQIEALLKQAEALEANGVVSRETISSVQAQLATFDLQAKSIETLTPALVDYIAAEKGLNASSSEGQAIANGFAQALQGKFQALTATGFVLDKETQEMIKNGTETERIAALVKVLDSTYAGFNETLGETTNDGLKPLMNTLGDIQREIGSKVIQAINAVAPAFQAMANFVKENLNNLLTAFKVFFGTLGTYIATTKIVALFTSLRAAIIGTTAVTGLANIANLAYTKTTLAVEAALIRARTAAIAFQTALGAIAAVAVGAGILIQRAAKKVEEAWNDASDAQQKASDAQLQLVKINIERRKLAEESGSEKVKELADAEYEWQKAIVQNLSQDIIQELNKRRQAAREALADDSKATEEWAEINLQAREKVIPSIKKTTNALADNTDAADEAKSAAEKAKQELESFQNRMISFVEESKKVKQSLEEDLANSFKTFGDGLKGNVEETVQTMAQLVIGAEDKIKELREKITNTDDPEQRDALKKQLKEQEKIVEARAGFEERQAERINAIRTKLEESGIDATKAGLDNLLSVRTLEEEIEEQRRLASLDEFTRFEEQQAKKLILLTDNLITEVTLTREKISKQEAYEQELTDYLLLQEKKRLTNTDQWAQQTIAKYQNVADSLKSLLTLQSQIGNLKPITPIATPSIPASVQPTSNGSSVTNNSTNISAPVTINGQKIQNLSAKEISAIMGFELNKFIR